MCRRGFALCIIYVLLAVWIQLIPIGLIEAIHDNSAVQMNISPNSALRFGGYKSSTQVPYSLTILPIVTKPPIAHATKIKKVRKEKNASTVFSHWV